MDSYGQNGGMNVPPGQFYPPPQRQANGMGIAALIMAVLALLTICTGVGPLCFGSLAIIFALLSKGDKKAQSSPATLSMLIAVFSMVAGVLLTGVTVYQVMNNPDLQDEFNDSFESMYGVSYEEFVEQMEEYYETGEMPEFMEEMNQGDMPYFPGGGNL